jgi:hypothetical protein
MSYLIKNTPPSNKLHMLKFSYYIFSFLSFPPHKAYNFSVIGTEGNFVENSVINFLVPFHIKQVCYSVGSEHPQA